MSSALLHAQVRESLQVQSQPAGECCARKKSRALPNGGLDA